MTAVCPSHINTVATLPVKFRSSNVAVCIKTALARITKSSLWAAPRTLGFCDKISCPWVRAFFPLNESVKEAGVPPLRSGYFTDKLTSCSYACI